MITETWLKPIDSVAVNELCPASYVFKNFARPSDRAGGGTGIMFRDSLDVSLVDGKEHFSLLSILSGTSWFKIDLLKSWPSIATRH